MNHIVRLAELVEAPPNLPPHPSWCRHVGRPLSACASGTETDPFEFVTHYSMDLDRYRRARGHGVFLVRDDDVEFGVGEVRIGISGFCEDEPDLHPAEAERLALDLLGAVAQAEPASRG